LLIVIHNANDQTLRLDNLKLEYITPSRTHIDATPAKTPYFRKYQAAQD